MKPVGNIRKLFVAGSAIATAALVVGCTSGSGSTAESAATDTIRTSFMADPTSFSPLVQRGLDDAVASRLMYDTLVRRDTGGVAPGLATSWEVTPTESTFTIRDGATCADGTPITASVVANSLKTFTAKETGSPFVGQVFGSAPESITADDAAKTVNIKLNKPFSDVLIGMAHPATGIICPAGLADTKAMQTGEVPDAVSGPYRLVKRERGVAYTFELRDDYDSWAEFKEPIEGVPAQKIEFSVSSNYSSLANELLTGSRDVVVINGKDAQRFEGNQEFTVTSYPSASLYLVMNEREGSPFTDPKARQAVAAVIDRTGMNQASTGGLGDIQTSIALPGVQCANTDESLLADQDPEAATKVLKGMKIRILGSQAFGPGGAAGEYAAEALRAAGADVQLRNVDNGTWVSDGTQKVDSWDMTFMVATFANMNSFLAVVSGTPTEEGGLNWSGSKDPKVSQAIAAAHAATEEGPRCDAYHEAEARVIEQAHAIPMNTFASQATARKGFVFPIFDGYADQQSMRIVK